jgi:hypothetical protein
MRTNATQVKSTIATAGCDIENGTPTGGISTSIVDGFNEAEMPQRIVS